MTAPAAVSPPWAPGPHRPTLRSGEVHVWCVRLDGADLGAATHELLDVVERTRAERRPSPTGRARFVTAHAATRLILGSYLGRAPHELGFSRWCDRCCRDHGKPRVLGPASAGIDFNLSHSADVALLAVGRQVTVGVDVEAVTPRVRVDDLERDVLAPDERALVSSWRGRDRLLAFYHLWVAKEAILKARGVGLAVPPDAVDVSAAYASGGTDSPVDGRWHVRWLEVGGVCAAALAADRPLTSVRCFVWRPPSLGRLDNQARLEPSWSAPPLRGAAACTP